MKRENTSIRLKKVMAERNLRQVDVLDLTAPLCREYGVKMNKSDISQYVSGKAEPNQDKLFVLSLALNVSEGWLMGFDVSESRDPSSLSPLRLSAQEEHLVVTFRGLNEEGKEKAVERVEELLDVPRYQVKDPYRETADRVLGEFQARLSNKKSL